MSFDDYWANVNNALDAIRDRGDTVDDVMRILKEHFTPSSLEAFCADGGGDRRLYDELMSVRSDWAVVWEEADYYYVLRDRNGDMLTYVEGDVSRGDTAVR
jgi:hypothetical protein